MPSATLRVSRSPALLVSRRFGFFGTIAAAALIFCLGAPQASAAVTLDATSSTTATTGTTSFTFSHVLGSGSNRLVVCAVDIANPSSAVANVTPTVMFGSVAMTAITASQAPGAGQNTSKIESEMFYTNDAALGAMVGATTVTVTLPNTPTGGVAAGCSSYFGMAQAGPEAAGAAYNGSGDAQTISLTTAAADDLVVDSFSGGFTANGSGKSAIPSAGQTQLYNVQNAVGILGAGSYLVAGAPGPVSVSWTPNVSRLAYSAVAFAPTTTIDYTVTTAVNPVGAGTVTLSPNALSYASGSSVQVTATPSTYYTFTGFTGDLSTTTNPATLVVDSNKSLTANFAVAQCTLTVNVVGQGTAGPTGSYNCGSTINLTEAASAGYSFADWSGSGYSGTNGTASFILTSNTTETATFLQGTVCTLSTSVTGSGTVTLNPTGGTYSCGTNVQVTAVPQSGDYAFTGFSGALSGTTNPQTLDLTTSTSVSAAFTQVNFPLNVTTVGPGVVTLSPNQASYASGTQVILTATPNAGAYFSGFTGDVTSTTSPVTVTVNSTMNVTATFADAVITKDAVSHAVSSGSASTLSWTHVLGTGPSRAVVIAVGEADSLASPDPYAAVTSVTFNGVYATPIPGSIEYGGTSGMVQTQLFYLLEPELPAAGTYTIQVNLQGSIAGISAGAVSLFGVNQGPPEAVVVNRNTSGTDLISTMITTLTNNAWVVDLVEDGDAASLTANAGQTVAWQGEATLGTGASSTEAVATAGPVTLGWSGNANRLAQSLADFAPASGAVPATYTLTTSVAGDVGGTVSANPGLSSYPVSTGVLLTANAQTGYAFSSWSGDYTSTTNPLPITMDSNRNVVANFVSVATCNLTINIVGSGTVTPANGPYNCGSTLQLTATPAAGYSFTSYSGDFSSTDDPAYFTITADSTITAEFDPLPTCTLTVNKVGGGTVTPASGSYPCGTILSLQATANSGYAFSGYTGDLSSTANPSTITLSENMNITATFLAGTGCTLTTAVTGQGAVVPSSGTWACGTVIPIEADADAHYLFDGWSGALTGSTTPTTLTMSSDESVTANFVVNVAGVTGDTRTVTQPVYPPVCTVLTALQTSGSLVETSPDTTRVQAALNACPVGQAVEFSANGTANAFIIQPITLPAGVTMLVDPQVTIFGSITYADYACDTSAGWCNPLINVAPNEYPAPGSAIMGLGVIDGRGGVTLTDKGESWWKTGQDARPRLVYLSSHTTGAASDNFTAYQITLQNSPKFHLSGVGNDLTVWDVKIKAPPDSPNTDGIDPSGSSNITITHSYISDGDDWISPKADSGHIANVTIDYDYTYSGHGVSIGSETNAGLNNMFVHDLVIDNGFGGTSLDSLRIKSGASEGGEVYDVLYKNICINNGGDTIVIDPYYTSASGTLYPNFHDITFSNVHKLLHNSSYKSTMTGYNTDGVVFPLTVTLDNVAFDNDTANDFKAPSNFNNVQFTFGPGPVSMSSFLTTDAATASNLITINNGISNPTEAAYNCTNVFVYLAGDLTAPNATVAAGSSPVITAVLQNLVSPVQAGTISYPQQNAPTGSVELLEGTNVVGTATLSGRLAYITVPNITTGNHTYTAQYLGDTHFAAQSFGSFTMVATSGAPVAANAAATVPYNTATPITLSATGSGTLTYSIVASPLDGVLSGTAPNVIYTPNPGYSGPDSFTFKANNGADSNIATVSVTVLPAPPVANNQSVTVVFNAATPITLSASGTGTLTYAYGNPAHGTLTGTAPNLIYTPASNYSGPDSFTFTASNGSLSNTATVSITVSPGGSSATKLAFSTAPTTPIVSGGNAGSVIVEEETAGGTVASSASDGVTLAVSGPNGYTASYMATASSGMASFNFASTPLTAAGTYTYTATSGALTQAQATEVVSPGAVASLAVAGFPSPAQTGLAETFTVTALDSAGNVATGFTGTVTLSSSDSMAALPAAYTFQGTDAGMRTFTATLNTAGTQSIIAQTGAIMGSQASITVLNSIWLINANGTLEKLGSDGASLTSAGSSSGTSTHGAIAFDHQGDVWAADNATNSVSEFSPAGTTLSVPGGFTGGGVNTPAALAIDGDGLVWIVNGNNTVTVLTSAGDPVSPGTGYTGVDVNGPTGIVVDSSGSVWISNSGDNSVTKIIGGAAPVTTPVVTATSTNTLGTRP